MAPHSAGLIMYRRTHGPLEVLLIHPGGPFWAKRDLASWSIPKGKIEAGEEVLAAAIREMREETGVEARGPFIPLGEIRHKSGKRVTAFGFEGDCDANAIVSITTEVEWPPKSGRFLTVPEADRAEWFTLERAREKILPAQAPLLAALERALAVSPAGTSRTLP